MRREFLSLSENEKVIVSPPIIGKDDLNPIPSTMLNVIDAEG
jgi:hypothetical protein